jgi:hypothetical protein
MASRTVVRMPIVAGALALALMVVSCSSRTPAPPTPPSALPPVTAPAPDAKQCPVTTANGNGPPGEQPSSLHHGNGTLWTDLPPGGIDWGGTPEPDGSTSQKYPWWTVGTEGELTIEGHRLDTKAAPPLRARVNSGVPETYFAAVPGGRFWSSGVSFPTEGCWQVTGRVGATSLTFVVFMAN